MIGVRMKNDSLNIFAELKDADEELEFQRHTLSVNRRFVYLGALIMSLSWLSFIQNDFIIYGNSLTAYLFLSLRLSLVGMGIAISLMVRRNEDVKQYEMLALAFWSVHLFFIFFGDAVRPGVPFLHIIVDLLALILSYIIIPYRLRLQVIPAFLFTSLSIARMVLLYEGVFLEQSGTIITFIMTNIIGMIMSWQRNADRRKRYLGVKRLKVTNQDLQNALSEIKTLQGIIPICARCKKIRDDQGYWNNLESYIQKHSDASFSHGMCTECSDELYGDQNWYIRMKQKNATPPSKK